MSLLQFSINLMKVSHVYSVLFELNNMAGVNHDADAGLLDVASFEVTARGDTYVFNDFVCSASSSY